LTINCESSLLLPSSDFEWSFIITLKLPYKCFTWIY